MNKLLLDVLKIDPNEIVSIKRLGKPVNDRRRLLRVSFSSAMIKRDVVLKARLLKNSTFKDVYIKPDLTLMQRERDLKLRKEMMSCREDGEDVVIYRGQVRRRSELKGFRLRF